MEIPEKLGFDSEEVDFKQKEGKKKKKEKEKDCSMLLQAVLCFQMLHECVLMIQNYIQWQDDMSHEAIYII